MSDEPPTARSTLRHLVQRWLLQACAVLCLGLAVLGAVTPGLPTTVFVLLAAWAAARSSPRLHGWIMAHRVFGPLLAHWQQGRVPRRAKWAAAVSMTVAALILVFGVDYRPLAVFGVSCMAVVLIWLWRKPEP